MTASIPPVSTTFVYHETKRRIIMDDIKPEATGSTWGYKPTSFVLATNIEVSGNIGAFRSRRDLAIAIAEGFIDKLPPGILYGIVGGDGGDDGDDGGEGEEEEERHGKEGEGEEGEGGSGRTDGDDSAPRCSAPTRSIIIGAESGEAEATAKTAAAKTAAAATSVLPNRPMDKLVAALVDVIDEAAEIGIGGMDPNLWPFVQSIFGIEVEGAFPSEIKRLANVRFLRNSNGGPVTVFKTTFGSYPPGRDEIFGALYTAAQTGEHILVHPIDLVQSGIGAKDGDVLIIGPAGERLIMNIITGSPTLPCSVTARIITGPPEEKDADPGSIQADA